MISTIPVWIIFISSFLNIERTNIFQIIGVILSLFGVTAIITKIDITIIKTATPSMIPIKEKADIIFKKPSFFLGFKFRDVINFSTYVNNLVFYFFYNLI